MVTITRRGGIPTEKLQTLKRVFGHDAFRPGQEELVDALLQGRDVLGIMPTGAGKSMCYQLPALMSEGIALVISPLISLMKDQVSSLKAAGVPAAYINSALTPSQQAEALRRAAAGAYKIIYVAPERLALGQFISFAQQAQISLIAVDEAHCVSQWGQDFRPSYLHISSFVEALPQRPPVAAYTATATRRVREDIVRLLKLQDPVTAVTGYDRQNLTFLSVKPTNRYVCLTRFLDEMDDACGIIYCNSRKTVEELTLKLKANGYSATRYHAGLTPEERRDNQEEFQYDRARIMVATNAFGMGIDKSDVRFVVHYNMPRSMEGYYQEAGRAGRDGLPSKCLLLYSGQDVILGQWMIDHGEPNPDLTAEEQKAIRRLDHERLRQMAQYATSTRCLRRNILQYFGERGPEEECGNCSVCLGMDFETDTGNPRPIPRDMQSRIRREEKLAARRAKTSLTAWETAMLENLKELRKLIAHQAKVPPYIVFSDATLIDMVRRQPRREEEFLEVSGVGETKCALYAPAFLQVLRDGQEPNDVFQEYHFKRGAHGTVEKAGK